MENDMKEVNRNMQNVLQMLAMMRKKQFGRKSDVASNKIEAANVLALLQTAHKIDNVLLALQHMLDQTVTHSCYVQRQLKLRKV